MNWHIVSVFVGGLFIGAFFGLFVLSLCIAAKRGDECERCACSEEHAQTDGQEFPSAFGRGRSA